MSAAATTGAETRQEQAQRRRSFCPDCGGLTPDEVRRAVTMLPAPFIMRQTGHTEEEDIICDLERPEAVCQGCDGATFAAALLQSFMPCRRCGPNADVARILGTRIGEIAPYLGAIGMLPERCPRCKTVPPWEPARRRNDERPEGE